MTDFRQLPSQALGVVAGKLALALALAIAAFSFYGPAAHAQTYKNYRPGTGARPVAGVTIRGDFVFGTASYGGLGSGDVYEIKHLGDLYGFNEGEFDPPGPQARVLFGPDGHLYGTFTDSFSNSFVFNLIPSPTICRTAQCQPWKVNVLHAFTGSDGTQPGYGDLTWDQQGNIYGTTVTGGTKELGVVYEMMPPVPPSQTWTESVIWNFTGPDGENPQNAVVFDGNGNLLGTAKQGGANGFGTVFKLTPSGNGWTEMNIHDFQGGSDGEYPIAGLMTDSSGNIYGATSDGGSGGGGTVFELAPSGNTYTYRLLYSFSGQQGNSCGPWATLSMDAAGNLYGTTYCDGTYAGGAVFELTNTQNGWLYTSLHDFPAFHGDGYLPISNVAFDANGNLWGTASRDTGGGYWARVEDHAVDIPLAACHTHL